MILICQVRTAVISSSSLWNVFNVHTYISEIQAYSTAFTVTYHNNSFVVFSLLYL